MIHKIVEKIGAGPVLNESTFGKFFPSVLRKNVLSHCDHLLTLILHFNLLVLSSCGLLRMLTTISVVILVPREKLADTTPR